MKLLQMLVKIKKMKMIKIIKKLIIINQNKNKQKKKMIINLKN